MFDLPRKKVGGKRKIVSPINQKCLIYRKKKVCFSKEKKSAKTKNKVCYNKKKSWRKQKFVITK